ncbi:MAG: hypothetical protein PWQ06_2507 [Anaerophaga sp.]|nr:hypothetical protein [Anaerophaga sp.]
MKKVIKHSYIIVLSIFIAGLSSCNEFDEFESIDVSSTSSVEASIQSVADSSFVVEATNTDNGYVVVGLAATVDTETDFDPQDFANNNIEGFEYQKSKTIAGEAVTFEYTGLAHNTEYKVVVVATNSNGYASEPVVLNVTTGDSHKPKIVSTVPEVDPSLEPALPVDGSLIIEFDEPVLYDETKSIEFTYFYGNKVVSDFEVTVVGNLVKIVPDVAPAKLNLVFVNLDAGVFTDLNGQGIEAVESGIDGEGYPYGMYYRVAEGSVVGNVIPSDTSAVVSTDFTEITIDFDEPITAMFTNTDSIMAIEMFWRNGDQIRKVVTPDMVSFSDTVAVIQLPVEITDLVTKVTLDVDGGVFEFGYGSPNAPISAEWDIKHSLHNWIGLYTVEAVSYGNPGEWDEVWEDVSIIPTDYDENTLIISGIAGENETVLAVFDDEAMTVTIEGGQYVGGGYGLTINSGNSDLTLNEGSDIVGDLSEDGSIHIDLLGLLITEGDYAGYVYDVFDTYWAKQE